MLQFAPVAVADSPLASKRTNASCQVGALRCRHVFVFASIVSID